MTRFSDFRLKQLPVPSEGKRENWFSEGGGLYIKVTPKGKKTWYFIYSFEGRQDRIRLGAYPGISLSGARQRAFELSNVVSQGNDPKIENTAVGDVLTVSSLAHEYIENYAKPRKKAWKEDCRIIERYVLPLISARNIREIGKADISFLLEPIINRGALTQADRVRAVLSKMFNFAVDREYIVGSPVAGIKPCAKKVSRDNYLTPEDIKIFFHKIDSAAASDPIKRALKLILVTGQRPGEVIGMRKAELHGDWWIIPKERVKTGVEQKVYLTSLAKELIGQVSGSFVFESPRGGKAIEVNALAHAIRRNGFFDLRQFTPHDLRRTTATGMVSLDISIDVVDRVMNHKIRGVTGVYIRHGYEKQKKIALQVWSDYLQGFVNSAF